MNALQAQKYLIGCSQPQEVIYCSATDRYSFEENSFEENSFEDEVVLEITEVFSEYNDYVYDIETEDGSFGAGVGSIIVHNTDSVFVRYTGANNGEDIDFKDKEKLSQIIEECYKLGDTVAGQATKMFKEPIQLEFEKVYLPLIMLKKKMYIGSMYEPPNSRKFKIDKKGIVLKRRDNPNITKIIYQGIIDILFSEGKPGIKRSLMFLHTEIQKILDQETDLQDLVITKTYKSNYKSENIPHKILAERMKERDAGSAPNFNDRVPYVFVETKNKTAKQFEKVEHPEYVKANGLKIDSLYYIDQIRNPITQLLSSFMPVEEINKIFDSHQRDYVLKKAGQRKITQFFPIKAKGV